jgi:thiol-disulfide isomerase/thioredoxin
MQERHLRLGLFGRLTVSAAVASLALVAVTAIVLARPGWRDAVGLGPRPAYATRSRIDVPPEVYRSSPFTIVLFARSTCAVCRSSVPFLTRLVQEAAASGVAVRLVSSAPVAPAEVAFAQALGLGATQLVGVDVRALRVKQVPTVVLVDRSGDIRYAREGAVPAVDQDELLRTLSSLTRLSPIR